MKLDDLIEALNQAKNELGGDTDIRIHIECGGNGDFVNINEVAYSKIFGLRMDVDTPWFLYKKD